MKNNPQIESQHLKDLESCYRTALELYVYEGNLTWNRYNVMVVATSILTTNIGYLLSSPTPNKLMITFLAGVGIALSILWYSITSQGFWSCKHYYYLAMHIESELFVHHRGVFQHVFSRSLNDSEFCINNKKMTISKSKFLNSVPIKWCALFTIIIFIIIYISVIAYTFIWLRKPIPVSQPPAPTQQINLSQPTTTQK